MKCVIIIQARMTSTRLPGKILREVLKKPLLVYQLERLKNCLHVDDIVVATTSNASDDPIIDLCQQLNTTVFRGSESDVLARYYGAACQNQAENIVRITSDCPLIDPCIVDQVIQSFKAGNDKLDYVSNTIERTYPRGLDTEVFSFTALKEAFEEATNSAHREHVTPFFYTQPQRYRMEQVTGSVSLAHHRWTVDVQEDFELIRRILEALYPINPDFRLEDILELLRKHPDWSALNSHIEQVHIPL